MSTLQAIAGIDIPIDRQLRLLEKGEGQRHITWVKHRVAVFTYEDPLQTGLGDDIALIMAREILFNSGVYSLGVLNFRAGLSPDDSNGPSYFDKVTKLTENEDVTLSIWGRVLPAGDKLLVDTFVQLPARVVGEHFVWKLQLPLAMGGGNLQAHLRPDRIRLQSLKLDMRAREEIASAANKLRVLRENPAIDSAVVAEIPENKVYSVMDRRDHWVQLKIKDIPKGWTPAKGHCTGSCKPLIESGQFTGGLLQYIDRGKLRNATDNLTAEALAVEEQIKALDGLNSTSATGVCTASLQRALRWVGPSRWKGTDKWTKIDRGRGAPPGGAAFANIRALAEIAIKLHEAHESIDVWSRRLVKEEVCKIMETHMRRRGEAVEGRDAFGREAESMKGNIDKVCSRISKMLQTYPERLSSKDLQLFLNHEFIVALRELDRRDYDVSLLARELQRSLAPAKTRIGFNDIKLSSDDIQKITVTLAQASLEDPNNVDVLQNLAVLFTYLGQPERAQVADKIARSLLSGE
jgi:hypothetical protein